MYCSLIALASKLSAQQSTYSLYSAYGLGIENFEGNIANTSMGGISSYSDNFSYAVNNPATYADLKLTSFGIGTSRLVTQIKAHDGTATAKQTSFDYLNIAIPTGKFGFGIGLRPYRTIAYRLQSEQTDNILGDFSKDQQGSGTVNNVYFGLGSTILKGLKLGAEFQYNFGRLEEQIVNYYETTFDTRYIYQTDVSGFAFNFAAIYDYDINETTLLRLGVTHKISDDFSLENSQERATVTNENGIDVVEDIESVDTEDRSFKIPSVSTASLSIKKQNRWFAATELYSTNNMDYGDPIYDRAEITYIRAYGAKLGGHYIPKFNSLTNYFNKITYRFGAQYDRLGVMIENEQIENFGISFGLGLPLPRQYSLFDIGFKLGTRGRITDRLVKENYFRMSLGLTLGQKWFKKRKYN